MSGPSGAPAPGAGRYHDIVSAYLPLSPVASTTGRSRYGVSTVLVHRLARLLHASFRPSVVGTPLRFATTSPPSGCRGDFHPRAVEHARHTRTRRRAPSATPRPS